MLEIRLGLLGLAQQVQQPAVGVQVGGVVGLQLDGAAAHLERLAQLAALLREVVCIIVEHGSAVGVDLQSLLIDFVSLLAVLQLLVIDVAGDREGLGQVVVVALGARQVRHHVALRQDGVPVLLDVAHAQLEQLDVVVFRMQLAVQVHQSVDRIAPYPVEGGVDVVHQHGQVVALHLRTQVLVVDQLLQRGEESREIARPAQHLRPPELSRGELRIHQQGLVVIGQGRGILPGGDLGVCHHREGIGVVVQRRRHLDQLFDIVRGADLVAPGVVERRHRKDVPGIGRIRLHGLQEMRLGRVEVTRVQLAQAEVVVDGVVVRVLRVKLREQLLRLAVLTFGVGRRGRQEKIIPRLPLRREGAREQKEGCV